MAADHPKQKVMTVADFQDGFPEFFRGFLVAVGNDQYPGQLKPRDRKRVWLVHPNGNDFYGPFDSEDEAKGVAKTLASPLKNDAALAELFEAIEEYVEHPGLYGPSTMVEAYAAYRGEA